MVSAIESEVAELHSSTATTRNKRNKMIECECWLRPDR